MSADHIGIWLISIVLYGSFLYGAWLIEKQVGGEDD
tara:strand:- start:299 stop:406 length:108 start_codon:yes stop_codon:yes gene_type:complete